jgi:hypothetical protein
VALSDIKEAKSPKAVAPENPSIASGLLAILSPNPDIQTLSPDIDVGYAKNKKALAVNAIFTTFIPVPPKISLPIMTANAVAKPTIHKGTSAGMVRGMSIPETKNPSCKECPRIIPKRNSTPNPTP